MTHQEILEKAIEKAIENGWKPECMNDFTNFKASIRSGQGFVRWFNNDGMEVIENVERVIYNQDFAKALWGEFTEADHNHAEKKLYETASKLDHKKAEAILSQGVLEPWQYHLMQMVISDDPIEYLGDNI